MKYHHINILSGHIRLYDKDGNCLKDIPATIEFLEDAVCRIYGHTKEGQKLWILRKIIVDDPGKAGDGSDAKIHSDIVFQGNPADLQEEMIKREIIKPIHSISSPESWKKLATSKGYLLYLKQET